MLAPYRKLAMQRETYSEAVGIPSDLRWMAGRSTFLASTNSSVATPWESISARVKEITRMAALCWSGATVTRTV